MNAIALSISDTIIRQDAEGRFCLNDLHKASGNEDRHRPSRWAENAQTKELIEELSKAGITALVSIKGGSNSGTFAVKELVYAYAMWISAKFHIAVIRAYDALVSGPKNAPKVLPEPPTISKAQAGELCAMVANKSKSSGKPIAYFWSRFNNHWKLASYRDLPADQFEEAKDYLRRLEGDEADQFMLLTPLELSAIIRENLDRQPLTVNITVGEHLERPKQWLLTCQGAGESLRLSELPDNAISLPPGEFVEALEKRGYLVMHRDEFAKKLAEFMAAPKKAA